MAGSNTSEGEIGFQLAPMIDLILVMLVFFMIQYMNREEENVIKVNLPGPPVYGLKNDVELIIGIDPDGTVNINDLPLAEASDRDLLRVRSKLKEQMEFFGDRTPIVISPQPDVIHQRVVDVLNACSAIGVKNLSFSG